MCSTPFGLVSKQDVLTVITCQVRFCNDPKPCYPSWLPAFIEWIIYFNRVFYKIVKIVNNGNIGITGDMWKQKKSATECYPSEHWTWDLCYLDVMLSSLGYWGMCYLGDLRSSYCHGSKPVMPILCACEKLESRHVIRTFFANPPSFS